MGEKYGDSRILDGDGALLTAEDVEHAVAKATFDERVKRGLSVAWEKWCGWRTGWNGVARYWSPSDPITHAPEPEPRKRRVGAERRLSTASIPETDITDAISEALNDAKRDGAIDD